MNERPSVVLGRNPVLEALRAGVPARRLLVARRDQLVGEMVRLAGAAGVRVVEVDRGRLDAFGAAHQGVVLEVAPFRYVPLSSLVGGGLLVACDSITDQRNVGAIARSALAFGAAGLVLPERRAAGVGPGAWKASAGALARLPVARVTNLGRALLELAGSGVTVVGLAGDGPVDITQVDVAGPLALVVGGEGRGLSRLVRERCDLVARIGLARGVESLNAAVAAGVALHEVARRRG